MNEKVAILGANGALGRCLIQEFQREGRSVRALTRYPDQIWSLLRGKSEALPLSLLEYPESLLTEYLKGCDTAIFAAVDLGLRPVSPEAAKRANRFRREGTEKLIQCAIRAGVRSYVHQSTTAVYRDQGQEWIDESSPLRNEADGNVEIQGLLDMEALVHQLSKDHLEWHVLRTGLLTGPGTAEESIMADLWEGRIEAPANPFSHISLTHPESAAPAFVAAAGHRSAGRIFNIVEKALPYDDYLNLLADRLSTSRPVRGSGPLYYAGRCSSLAAQRDLGWTSVAVLGL